jgi:excisionase family DNA binding protein
MADPKTLQDFPEMLNARMIAEILGVGYTKSLNLLKYGDLPYLKIGNTFRVHKRNFEKWLEASQKREYLTGS